MPLTRRRLAILSNTRDIFITPQEQRLAASYLAGVYGDAKCPYKAKACKEAFKIGKYETALGDPGPVRSDAIRRRERLPDVIAERMKELDQ